MAIIRTNFLSKSLGRQVDFNVIIPTYSFKHTQENAKKPYDTNRKFKVLMLLHGFSGDCNDYLTFSNIARYAESHDLAVIMPSGFNRSYTDDQEGDKVHSFVAKELLEVCGFLFPISLKREDVYIGGLSMGAMGAMKIALAHSETFSEVLCMSGAPQPLSDSPSKLTWFGTDPDVFQAGLPGRSLVFTATKEDAFYNAKKNIEEKKLLPRIKMTIGSKDFLLEPCRSFYKYIKELGYDVEYTEIDGFGHEWDFWDQELREAINHFFTLD